MLVSSNMRCIFLVAISLSAVVATICPGGGECPGIQTCCKISAHQFGCCPYPNAVCCADHEHCCPFGYICQNSTCIQAETTSTENTLKRNERSKMCSSKQDYCLNKDTCCPSKYTGRFGCCPLPNAICCEDNLHCCPSGATCDLVNELCILDGISFPLVRKIEATPSESSKTLLIKTGPATPANTVCPDPRYSCSGTDPCCRTPGGSWTCCNYPYGSCCADGLHCCPYGMQCVSSSYCVKANLTIPTRPSYFTKDNSHASTVICPNKAKCPDGNTCCKMTSDSYGCCPLPNAVCCADDIHCCPHGYTCNVQSGSCSDGVKEIPWSTKTPTL